MFNELAKEINNGVRAKGFWDSMHDAVAIVDDRMAGDEDCASVVKSVKDAFIAQKVALIISEASEALEAMRKPDYEANWYGIGQKDSFADELADTVIRLLDLCGELDIDIDAQIAWKMEYNAGRAPKHGKEF